MQDTDATTTTSRRDSRIMRGRVPQPLDVVVDRGVLLDVGVGLRDVRLGLVVVVVGDEVLDRVVRQHLPQLVGQLRGQRLVRRHHQRGPLHPLDQPGRGGRLAGAGGAEQHDVLLARREAPLQLVDRRRLVAGRLVVADHLEPPAGARDVAHRAVLGVGERASRRVRVVVHVGCAARDLGRECHGSRVRAPTDSFASAARCHGPSARSADAPAEDRDLRRPRPRERRQQGLRPGGDEYRDDAVRALHEPRDGRPRRAPTGCGRGCCPRWAWPSPTSRGTRGTSATRTSTSTSARSSGDGGPVAAHRPLPRHRRAHRARRRGARRRRVRGGGGRRAAGHARRPSTRCTRSHAAVDGLAAHGHDLDAWLAGFGITPRLASPALMTGPARSGPAALFPALVRGLGWRPSSSTTSRSSSSSASWWGPGRLPSSDASWSR